VCDDGAVTADQPAPPSGTVTFLFTDVEGSTRLWAADSDAMSASLLVHDGIVKEAIESAAGYVFATAGDSFAAAFARASDAVTAAQAAQSGLTDADWPGPALRVRIGMHLGEAEERGGDYFGPTVNIAARVEAAGHGGQVVLTEVVVDAAGVVGHFLGQHRLKDLQHPLRLFQLGEADFPALRTVDERLTNLPVVANELVGRDADLKILGDVLDDHRLVTLTGVGGVGKTRLAQAAAFGRIGAHLEGVWSVELAKCSDAESVLSTVVAALGLVAPSSVAGLVDLVRGHDVLLVLDNCEHVLDEVYDLCEALLGGCSRLRVLATSREGIGLPAERVVVVRSLDVEGARALFVERVRQTGSTIDMDATENSVAISEICERLDGIALAIELAAATTRVLSPVDIAARLDERFVLLRGSGRRRGVERHQTLRAAVDWSYETLDDTQQRFFRRLGVFAGGICLSAAEFLADDLDRPAIQLLSDLVERSLLVADHQDGRGRYSLLETLRQYGLDRLVDHDELEAATEAHAFWCRDFAIGLEPALAGPDEIETIWRLDAETANFRVAIAWALDTDNSQLAIDLLVAVADIAMYDPAIAELCGPVTAGGVSDNHPYRTELLTMEFMRLTSARQAGDNRNELATELFETVDAERSGFLACSWGMSGIQIAAGDADRAARIAGLGRAQPDPERVRFLAAALLATVYTTDIDDFSLLLIEATAAAEAAGTTRYLLMCGIATALRIAVGDDPTRLVELAEHAVPLLSRLPPGSTAVNIFCSYYTEAAIRAGLPTGRLFAAVIHLDPVLRGDFDRFALSLGRLVERHGNPALAVRALSGSVAEGRSYGSAFVREAILAAATDTLGADEVAALLRVGASQDPSDLYREMWAHLQPFMLDKI
jgi:predicted ATPase/class 3 adenylate cyclase